MTEKRIWELLARQFSGEITAGELLELESLLSREAEKAPYGELLSDLHVLALQPDAADRMARDRSLASIRKNIRENSPGETDIPAVLEERIAGSDRKTNARWALGLAALLLFLPAIWLLTRTGRTMSAAEPFDRIVTKTGSKTLINLPDSSTVMLKSACQFSYNKNFGVRRREMHLTGEAWFDIHGNPEMPLVVHAGNVLIRVLGTTFNVKANAGDSFVEATLIKGAIEVSLLSDPERRILLRPGEKILIRKDGDTAASASPAAHRSIGSPNVITVSRAREITTADSSIAETDFIKDKMQFRKESFGSLIKRMEAKYNVRIILADSSLEGMLFTGSFEKETVGEALQALRNSAPFDYSMEGSTITITRRKK